MKLMPLRHKSEKKAIATACIPDEKERRQLPFLSLLHLHASCVALILLHQQNLDDHTIVAAIYDQKNAEHVTRENS
jgi:hypothetical protein